MNSSHDLKNKNSPEDHCLPDPAIRPEISQSNINRIENIIIRRPDVDIDLSRLIVFFASLPPEVRNYLRYNVTETDTCRRRLEQIDGNDHWRLFAEDQGRIIADTTMDREPFCWNRHVAQVRAVISPQYLHHGVDRLLLIELVEIGAQAGIELLYTEVMEEQTDLIRTLKNVGFKKEARRKRYAKDLNGRLHDVIIMANHLEEVWRRLADLMMDLDTRGRKSG